MERVNLPSQNGCISFAKSSKDKDPKSNIGWFLFKNSCAYPVQLRWCNGEGCVNSTQATKISGGDTYETWVSKKNKQINFLACQLSSGNDEVYSDWPGKQCWSNILMK